jgi:hypothetical protein
MIGLTALGAAGGRLILRRVERRFLRAVPEEEPGRRAPG